MTGTEWGMAHLVPWPVLFQWIRTRMKYTFPSVTSLGNIFTYWAVVIIRSTIMMTVPAGSLTKYHQKKICKQTDSVPRVWNSMQQIWLPAQVTDLRIATNIQFQLLPVCHVPLSGSSSFLPPLSFTLQGSWFVDNLSLYSSRSISTSDLHRSATPCLLPCHRLANTSRWPCQTSPQVRITGLLVYNWAIGYYFQRQLKLSLGI
jgi:hypothetical protein